MRRCCILREDDSEEMDDGEEDGALELGDGEEMQRRMGVLGTLVNDAGIGAVGLAMMLISE